MSANPPHFSWDKLPGASVGLALSRAIVEQRQPFLIVAPDQMAVARLIEALQFFLPDSQQVFYFPDWETLPYDHFSPHQDITSDRLAVLSKIPLLKQGAIITTIATLMQRLPPRQYLDGHAFLLKAGQPLNLDALRKQLESAGYHCVSQVREHGEFAVRGSIIDLFPMGSDTPFRIDLFDEEIDSIRLFQPDTQRSLEQIAEIRLLPAKEFPLHEEAIEHFRHTWRSQFTGNPLKSSIYQDVSEGICPPGIEYYLPFFFEKTASFFDYLPENTLITLLPEAKEKAHEFWQEITLRYEQGRYDITRPLLPPEQLFLGVEEIVGWVERSETQRILPRETLLGFATLNPTYIMPDISLHHASAHPLAKLQAFLADYHGRILFCAETMGRREVLLQLFNTINLHPKFYPSWEAFLQDDAPHGITVAPLEAGFALENPAITLITETQLYGKRTMQQRLRKKTPQDTEALIRDLTELQIGDPVVHLDHGIGRYQGLQILKVEEEPAEFLCLEYAGGDKLYVPVASLNLISRYTGSDPEHAPLHKLGTEQWQKSKRKAEEKVRDVAAELLDLYARREAQKGYAFTFPEEAYTTFSAAFPFEETPDQLQAIEQVIKDMAVDKPMDRVVCGDVGFGKTEVALRAAFVAVQNNKQVAVLVPTTLLAQQHFQTFQDRFANWPIQVDMLSRFRSEKEQKSITKKLAEGKVDVLIGTHRLLQENMPFKSLGLVIVDEEHRFGVKQKERLKALRSSVDILTLTATPIPRTLNMGLAGIRDLSLIATPPARRLAVKTFLHDYQDNIVQEAIAREFLRGGQVYFVHNDVATIEKKAQELKKLLPEVRIGVAHGQMRERDLEAVMADFYHRRFHVLLCSTIIESGIDIPTANTIIINRADKFGLAQLHQLRGRVGRSHHQAYAYLLVPSYKLITADAKKRLDAIASLDELGIGFTLATHDLEIRGAGELLGEEQSGNMQEVGFTLYMDLLSRAVESLKSGKEPDFGKALLHGTEVDLHLAALIPESYLDDIHLRLQFYKRIAHAKTIDALDELQVEMVDRFGLLPPPLKNLFAITELKLKAATIGVIKLEANEKGGKMEFNEKPHIDPTKLIQLIQHPALRFRLEGPTRLRFTLDAHEAKERIQRVEEVLGQLQ